MKLVNIEICSTNRDNCLFNFFIPSLDKIKSLKDICSITINYNGDMLTEQVEEANNLIRQKGFELHWTYNHYLFAPRHHKILKVRNDCDKVGPKTKYILLGDDDLEFLDGYDRHLLAAINLLEQDERVGIVSFRSQPEDKQVIDTLMPASTQYFFVLCGGLLIRRVPCWPNLYPEELLELHGGGEERLIGCELYREGYRGYYLHTDNYIHEQRWKENVYKCGQALYKWSWNTNDITAVMNRVEKYRDLSVPRVNFDLAWDESREKFWLDPTNEVCFADRTTEELLNEVLASIAKAEAAQVEASGETASTEAEVTKVEEVVDNSTAEVN